MKQRSLAYQKKLWSLLGRFNPKYFIWSEKRLQSESFFYLSGINDFNTYFAPHIKEIANKDKKTVLEIGCGLGRVLSYFATHFEKAIGTDISPAMIKNSTKRFKLVENVEFYENDGASFPMIKTSSIDFIYSFIVFQHFKSEEMVTENLKEVKRMLKKNGDFLIQVRGKKSLKKNTWYEGVWFTEKKAKKLFESCGLKVTKMFYTHDKKSLWVKGKK